MSSYFYFFHDVFLLSWFSKILLFVIFFSVRRTSLCHCLRVHLLVKNGFSSPLSENIFISPSFLKDSFTRYRICSWQVFFFSFSTWKMSHFCQALVVSDEKSFGMISLGLSVYVCSAPWWISLCLLLTLLGGLQPWFFQIPFNSFSVSSLLGLQSYGCLIF